MAGIRRRAFGMGEQYCEDNSYLGVERSSSQEPGTSRMLWANEEKEDSDWLRVGLLAIGRMEWTMMDI
jgi:hypothetical protein